MLQNLRKIQILNLIKTLIGIYIYDPLLFIQKHNSYATNREMLLISNENPLINYYINSFQIDSYFK